MSLTIDETAEQSATLSVAGMNCVSCVSHVSKAARSLPGVQSIDVNLAGGRAVVRFDPSRVDVGQISSRITDSGYPTHPAAAVPSAQKRSAAQALHAREWLHRAIAGAVLWLPLELIHWATQFFLPHSHVVHLAMIWAALVTSTIAVVYVGSSFYRSAWNALRHGTTNMDTLIAMGASVAYCYSLIFVLGGLVGRWQPPSVDDLYFMESSALFALISFGHWLEARARQSAGRAIEELLSVAPATALLLPDGGSSSPVEVPVARINRRDLVLVRPGDRVAVDGVVIDGISSVDESMITGEPIPARRTIGDQVIGGTINQEGRLVVRATAVGSESALAQIVQLVEKAQDSKPPVQKLADQVTAVFVPVVLGIAVVTALGWYGWGAAHQWPASHIWAAIARASCSVLLIACPCALGLAVPAALMVGTGLGARRGILIRDIDALQKAEKIDIVVLDKTGTVTRGKPTVSRILPMGEMNEDGLLRLAATAEQSSGHPLARAIVSLAQSKGFVMGGVTDFNTEAGYGITATIDGRRLIVGNIKLLKNHGFNSDGKTQGPAATLPRSESSVHIAEQVGDTMHYLGYVEIADEIKTDSAAAVADIRRMGSDIVLLTGDVRSAAEAVAAQVGIHDIRAEVRPAGKAAVIRDLQQGGQNPKRVAMVGDGINDAAALAQADLGIALGSGSDVAKETGDVILVGDSLLGITAAIRLSRATMRIIRQNLFFAFFYNVLAIPLAAFGILHPIVAAAAMALSDVTVVGNSLRLRWARLDSNPRPSPRSKRRKG